jgi:3-dehydroquinate synthase
VGEKLIPKTGSLLRRFVPESGKAGKIMVVTQKRIARYYGKPLLSSLQKAGFRVSSHFLPEGEKAKSQQELFRLYRTLLALDFERRDMLLALGGGVTGDLTGFAAATYLRGIAFINIGTTLLAQVDSSIGGKTGINLEEGKNLVGAFYPPKLVISDTRSLRTLTGRDFNASLAEVVKYGIIRDPQLFRLLESQAARILARDPKLLAEIVTDSARIKALVVSHDERETKGERMILNYGHTFGHGFEQALGYKHLRHGEAVSIGMVCAARLAVKLELFSAAEAERQNRLLEKLGLPISLSGLKLATHKILCGMTRDKKKHAGRLCFVLPVKIGKVVIREDVPGGLVRKMIEEVGGES